MPRFRKTFLLLAAVVLLATSCAETASTRVVPTESVQAPAENGASVGAPSAQSSDKGSGTAAIGDRLQIGSDQYFTVEKVQLWPGNEFLKPDAEKKFVSVLVEIEGISEQGASYNPFFFTVKDADGFEYNYSAIGKDPQLQSGNDLAPGEKVSGWMTFEVPADTDQLTLTYQPDFFDISQPARVTIPVPAK